jgi:hypothetical protein
VAAVRVVALTASPRWRASWPAVAVAAAVLVGLGVRGYAYLRNPSFWVDEAMLAVNVVERSPARLLEPLDLNQGAPIGFLMATKAACEALGGTEYALRLVPFVCGMLGVIAFVPLAYRALPLPAARLAVVLFALNSYLAGYAAEFKQYECDAAIAVGLTLVALPIWAGTAGRWRLVGMAVAGAAAVWCSHPAVFVLGGVGTAFLLDAAVRRDRAALLARAAVVGAWLASFAACYVLFLRKLGGNQYLLDYWAGKFMPPPVTPGAWMWLVQHFFEFFQKPGGMNADRIGLVGLAGLCYLVGMRVLAGRDWRLAVAVAVPMLLALAASAVKKYPFANRLMLFAVPAALMVVAYGAVAMAERLRAAWSGAGVALLGVLLVSPVAETYWLAARKPLHAEDAREAFAEAWAGWQTGDRMYVFYGAGPAFEYYHRRFPFPREAVRVGESPAVVTIDQEYKGHDPKMFADELAPMRGAKRVWVVIAHRQMHEETAIRMYLDTVGKGGIVTRRSDSVVLLYDLS